MNSVANGCVTDAPSQTVVLAIATIPMQSWEHPFDPKTALKHGTIFPSLDLPFYVTGGQQL